MRISTASLPSVAIFVPGGVAGGGHCFRKVGDLHFLQRHGVVPQRFKFRQGFDTQDAIGGQAQFTGQGLDGAAVHFAVVHADGRQPGPRDAAAIRSQHALRGEEVHAPWRAKDALLAPAPVHAAVFLRDELLGLCVPVAQVVAAAERMADAQQHPLVADRKEVSARDVLAVDHVGHVAAQKIADERPVLQVFRFKQRWILSAGDGVIGVADEEAIGIPMADLRLGSVQVAHLDWIGLLPRGELVVLRDSDLVSA